MILKKLQRRYSSNAKGFTLVELLIVVAIIAILAAIAEAYFTENPGIVLNDCNALSSRGYMGSTGTTCTASGFSEIAGSISVTGNTAWGLSVNAATIDYNGKLTSAVP